MKADKIFEQVVESIYESMPQSLEVDKIKARALVFMLSEFEKWTQQGVADYEAISLVIEHYGTEKKLKKVLGYYIEQETVIKKDSVLSYIKEVRKYSFLFSLCLCLLGVSLSVPAFYDYRIKVAMAAVFLLGAFFVAFLFMRMKHFTYTTDYFEEKAFRLIDEQYSLYERKLIIAMIIMIACCTMTFGTGLSVIRLAGLSFWEKISLSNLWLISVGLFFLIYNVINFKYIRKMYNDENDKRYIEYVRKCLFWSFTYLLLVWILRFFCQLNHLDVPVSMFSIAAIIYLFVFIFVFLLLRKNYLTKTLKINRLKKIISCGLVVVLLGYSIMSSGTWILQPYISTVATVAHENSTISIDDNGVYTIQMNKDSFNILQITDIHLGGSMLSSGKDKKALEAVYRLINHAKPDLVIVTGDFVFPLGLFSYSLDNYTPILQFATFMRNIGIPWAFVYGNHDTEVVATHTAKQLNKMFSQFSYEKSSANLLYSEKQPAITGRSNQIIKINNPDGSLNQVLYLLDSNSYASSDFSDYDYIHDDQVDWYKQSVKSIADEYGRTVNSLMFFHIPIKAYQTAYDLYKKGSPTVKYFFGKIGEENESIGASKTDSKLFDTIVELGSTKGIFVGHDHYNNISLEYEGVRLTYGMSIDYLAMPGIYNDTEQRGATLITINNDSSFDVNQIKLTEIWR